MSGIYIHIPFCKTHCTYCAFYSELLRDSGGSDTYVDALCREINNAVLRGELAPKSGETTPILPRTLYIGGGTPSVLTSGQISRIVKATGKDSFDEFTVEVNPDDILKNGEDYLHALKALGVNRISMGIQSFDDAVLHKMGRRHDAADAVKAYAMLRSAAFTNVSVDFIFGFTQNLDIDALKKNLTDLPGGLPEHISCYQLSVEEGSGLDKMQQKGIFEMPADEECEKQYYDICAMLRSLGYEHYEISNWARPGYRSRHNSAYWNHTSYVGFGPGAHSLFISSEGEYVRRWNNPDVRAYVSASEKGEWDSIRGSEVLTDEQIRTERLFLGLRTVEGIDGRRIPEEKWFVSDSIIADIYTSIEL